MKIIAQKLPIFQHKIETFNKKAVRFHLPEISYEILSRKMEERTYVYTADGDHFEQKINVEILELRITGEVPVLAGWTVHSYIEKLDKNQNLVNTLVNSAPISGLHTAPLFCEHCHTARLKKKAYYVVDGNGSGKMVGQSCLKDFTGCKDVDAVLAYMNRLKDISADEPEYGNWNLEQSYIDTELAVGVALILIRKNGFTSKTTSSNTGAESTHYQIHKGVFGGIEKGVYVRPLVVPEDTKLEAKAAINSILEAMHSQDSEYAENLTAIFRREQVLIKHFGYIAAGTHHYLKDKAARITQSEKVNEYVGQEGVRLCLKDLKVVFERDFESGYGLTWLYKFEDKEGRCYVTFASRKISQIGDSIVSMKGTVKKHELYNGVCQTVLTRCAIQ